MIKAWIEAMRLRTLPVSIAGVVCASSYAMLDGSFKFLPALLCFVFAVLAQISSNFANEYYDFKAGLDRVGRDGPRRGVTEGDITPQAMKRATFIVLALACAVGCSLIYWSSPWLIAVGVAIAVGVLAYSTGPYPLSHHGLGEVAVIFFFGLIPVNFTYYIMSSHWSAEVFLGSLAMGLMIANVLIVNNYRDLEDDRAVGKHTLAVMFGRKAMATLYLLNGIVAVALLSPLWLNIDLLMLIPQAVYLAIQIVLFINLRRRSGSALNPLLGMTALNILLYAVIFTLISAI